jgi:hypothetical protein
MHNIFASSPFLILQFKFILLIRIRIKLKGRIRICINVKGWTWIRNKSDAVDPDPHRDKPICIEIRIDLQMTSQYIENEPI